MRHVDEGLLHAWIDGAFEAGSPERTEIEAHLAACADCRVRLEDARRIRAVAHDALAAAAPADLAPPPWESIVAEHAQRRVRGGATAPPRTRPRIPLAWAASLVLAIGAGWLGRAMLVERALAPAATELDALSSPSAAVVDDRDAAGERQEAAGGGAVQALPEQERAPAAPAPTEPPVLRDATAPPPEANLARREAGSLAPDTLAFRLQAQNAASDALAKAARPRLDDIVIAGTVVASDETRRRSDAALRALGGASAAAPQGWVPADSAALAAAFPEGLVRVEGAAPDTVQLATVEGESVARSVFILPEGVVELLQRPLEAGLSDLPAGEESATAGRTVVLRGIEVLVRGTSAAAVQEVRARLR